MRSLTFSVFSVLTFATGGHCLAASLPEQDPKYVRTGPPIAYSWGEPCDEYSGSLTYTDLTGYSGGGYSSGGPKSVDFGPAKAFINIRLDPPGGSLTTGSGFISLTDPGTQAAGGSSLGIGSGYNFGSGLGYDFGGGSSGGTAPGANGQSPPSTYPPGTSSANNGSPPPSMELDTSSTDNQSPPAASQQGSDVVPVVGDLGQQAPAGPDDITFNVTTPISGTTVGLLGPEHQVPGLGQTKLDGGYNLGFIGCNPGGGTACSFSASANSLYGFAIHPGNLSLKMSSMLGNVMADDDECREKEPNFRLALPGEHDEAAASTIEMAGATIELRALRKSSRGSHR